MKNIFTSARTLLPILIVALYVVGLSERFPSYDHYYRARFGDMVYGTAWRPFVSRSFMPSLIRGTYAVIPSGIEIKLAKIIGAYPFLVAARPGDSNLVERAIYLFYEFWALVCFVFGLWRLMRFAKLGTMWAYISSLIVLGSLPVYFNYSNYIYDWTALALFTWSLVFLGEEHWFAYLLTLGLCIWNKETGVLLCWIFFLLYWRKLKSGDRKLWLLCAGQSLLAFVILAVTRWIYSGNPGTSAEWHLFDLKRQFYLGYTLQSYVTLLMLLFLILYRFRDQPRLLQKAVTVLPVLIVLTFFFGNLDEYRDYYEALPIVGTMISLTLYGFYSRIEMARPRDVVK